MQRSRRTVSPADSDVARTLVPDIIRPKILAVESAGGAPEALEAAPSTVAGEVWRDILISMILDGISHLVCAYDAAEESSDILPRLTA